MGLNHCSCPANSETYSVRITHQCSYPANSETCSVGFTQCSYPANFFCSGLLVLLNAVIQLTQKPTLWLLFSAVIQLTQKLTLWVLLNAVIQLTQKPASVGFTQ